MGYNRIQWEQRLFSLILKPPTFESVEYVRKYFGPIMSYELNIMCVWGGISNF